MSPQQPIEIILLRQWASHMATPIWIAGTRGRLLYYNEPAEGLLGKRFDEAGEMRLRDLPKIFETTTPDGKPLSEADLPLGKALRERQPAHLRVRITALDGKSRLLDITAVPLLVQGGAYLGAMAMFWEPNDS
jgi:PAS domain-containing protein